MLFDRICQKIVFESDNEPNIIKYHSLKNHDFLIVSFVSFNILNVAICELRPDRLDYSMQYINITQF